MASDDKVAPIAAVSHPDAIDASITDALAVERLAAVDPKFTVLSGDAKVATQAEQVMTVREAIRKYPKAVAWSMLLSSAIAMEGFDIVLISAFFAYPEFQKKYGEITPKGTYQVSAPWQAGLSNAARVGEIIGLLLNGWFAERYGHVKTMLASLVLLIGFIFIAFYSRNIKELFAADLLMGIPWGAFQTLAPAYASEVCPIALRPYLTTYVNMMWGVGQLLATGVLRALLSRSDQWSYRIPMALQWAFAVPLLISISFAPESPWFLVRRGRVDQARKNLQRLSIQSQEDIDLTIAMMRHTDQVEKEISAGTSYVDCFKGVNLRRTEITVIVWVIQAATGASLMGFSAYFFQQAGLPTTISFDFSLALYSTAIIGVVISWFVMARIGRRTIYLLGLSAMFLTLITIGFLAIPSISKGTAYTTGSLLLVFTLVYDIGVGTVAYSIVTEMPSSRLRTKTIVIARSFYNAQGCINSVLTPYMLNPTKWDWKGKAGFFWGGMAFICLTWCFFRLPEPHGRSFAEIDLLFERKVPARKFKSTELDAFEVAEHEQVEPRRSTEKV